MEIKPKFSFFFSFFFQKREFRLTECTISDLDENFCLAQKITLIYGQHHPMNNFYDTQGNDIHNSQ